MFIYLSDMAKGFVVRPSQILMLKVDGNYTSVSLEDGRSIVIRCPLWECQERLNGGGDTFFPIDRQCTVNLAHVQDVQPLDQRRLTFRLTNGEEITLSRLQTTQFRRQFSL
jgi:DNA-binding LytR/AlgR family response regulator